MLGEAQGASAPGAGGGNGRGDGGEARGDAGAGGEAVTRVVLCSGKVYYDLWERRRELEEQGGETPRRASRQTALIRVEQLYPFPEEALRRALESFAKAKSLVWAQEEPANRGALRYVREQLASSFPGLSFEFVSRPASASPAVGSHKQHLAEQRAVVDAALGLETGAAGPAEAKRRPAGGRASPGQGTGKATREPPRGAPRRRAGGTGSEDEEGK